MRERGRVNEAERDKQVREGVRGKKKRDRQRMHYLIQATRLSIPAVFLCLIHELLRSAKKKKFYYFLP